MFDLPTPWLSCSDSMRSTQPMAVQRAKIVLRWTRQKKTKVCLQTRSAPSFSTLGAARPNNTKMLHLKWQHPSNQSQPSVTECSCQGENNVDASSLHQTVLATTQHNNWSSQRRNTICLCWSGPVSSRQWKVACNTNDRCSFHRSSDSIWMEVRPADWREWEEEGPDQDCQWEWTLCNDATKHIVTLLHVAEPFCTETLCRFLLWVFALLPLRSTDVSRTLRARFCLPFVRHYISVFFLLTLGNPADQNQKQWEKREKVEQRQASGL